MLLLGKECFCFSFSERPKKGSDWILVENKTQVRFLPATRRKTVMNLVSDTFQWEIFQSEITWAWVWGKEIRYFKDQHLESFLWKWRKYLIGGKKEKEKKAFLTHTFWSALLFLFQKICTPVLSNSLWSASTFLGLLICSSLWSSQLLERRVYK